MSLRGVVLEAQRRHLGPAQHERGRRLVFRRPNVEYFQVAAQVACQDFAVLQKCDAVNGTAVGVVDFSNDVLVLRVQQINRSILAYGGDVVIVGRE